MSDRNVCVSPSIGQPYGVGEDVEAIALPMFNRQQNARIAKRKAEKPRRFRMHADGIGYDVLHPTKGWHTFSGRRVAAVGLTEAKRVGQLPWWFGNKVLERAAANG